MWVLKHWQSLWVLSVFIISAVKTNHISACGETNLTNLVGIIKSPNYPQPFPSQVECEWSIQSPGKAVLKLEILDLDLDVDCTQHYLLVPFEGGRGLNLLCGRKAPSQPISVVQPLSTIKYYSSELKKISRGFTLRYTLDPTACGPQDIHCRSGGCASNTSRCDGERDCDDGTDEMGCPLGAWCADATAPCPSSPKYCFSIADHTCDGEFFCPRGEDELSCAPGCPNQIACSSGDGCYDPTQRCNGVRNCRDNSDETDCVEAGCGPLELICRNGGCVAAASLCDGVDDCGDMSDEQHCAKSSLLAAATLGLLACVFLSCIGLSCLYRFYTARLRASTEFLQQLDTEGLEDGFVYREPPPSYSAAIAESNPLPCVEALEPPPRRHRRRQRRRRLQDPRPSLLLLGKQRVMSMTHFELAGRVMEPQWHTRTPRPAARSPSLSRDSETSSTSVEDLLLQ